MERASISTLQHSLAEQEDEESRGDDLESKTANDDDLNADTVASDEEQNEADEQTGEPPPGDSSGSSAPVRQKSQNSKVKLLVRSHAMREETSPPPDPERATLEPPAGAGRPSSRLRLKQQGSSQGSMDSNSPLSLSRDSSTEQPPTGDSSGVDLPAFLTETVNRSHKDRQLLLRIETELQNLVKDTKRTQFKFPPMSSYQRMLVHRMAALYNMEHNVDSTGAQVVVGKTATSKTPDLRLRDQMRGDLEMEPRKSILKRDTNSLDDPNSKASADSRRSKSFEEREEEYEKVRKRIFKQEGDGMRVMRGDSGLSEGDEVRSSQEDLRSSWAAGAQTWSSSDSSDGRPQLLRPSPPHSSSLRPSRLLKVESFESRDILRSNSMRQAVSKSYSFGGYSGGTTAPSIARGDSMVSTHSAGARLLTKQDSGTSSVASRLSPLSSGYKSLGSQRSDATMSATPSPTATPLLPQGPMQMPAHLQQHFVGPTLMWAVSSMDSVPAGSLLINPQTGQPYLNSDGSVYRYDPSNPPKLLTTSDPPPQPPSIQVHAYTCAPPPPPPPEYSQQPQVIYSYQAAPQAQHSHSHHSQCSQEGCCMTEITSYVTGMQINDASNACPAPPASSYVVAAPGWQPPQQAPPRPSLLPPPPPVSTQQQQNVVMPPSQQTVLLVQPQRPMALFPHSGGGAEAGYYSPPQTMIATSAPPNNNPGPMFQQQHTVSPSMRGPASSGEGVAFASTTGYYPAAPVAGMCPSYCFNPPNQVPTAASSSQESTGHPDNPLQAVPGPGVDSAWFRGYLPSSQPWSLSQWPLRPTTQPPGTVSLFSPCSSSFPSWLPTGRQGTTAHPPYTAVPLKLLWPHLRQHQNQPTQVSDNHELTDQRTIMIGGRFRLPP
ncbi:cAMP-regulated phosphoprotein 21 isoform X2 [Neocloeon triangulifer]|nr:cAMP-regulated phosphoprotein 21 isoform X2 [Neocloeon triangulifer]XP_059471555.1 cAMP-regulated phosphoprotein 21 isoform X2 [Neocloeon triangulifer]